MTTEAHDDAATIASFLADEAAQTRVIDVISPNDVMHQSAPDYYFHYGRDALRAIGLALRSDGGGRTLRTILDFPCGHGRVLRTMRAALPTAHITACDLDSEAVDFCAATFGATPAYSDEDPDRITLDGSFDLIWCGSLLTHLDHPLWPTFLGLFERVLSPHGLLVFTVHGPHIANDVRRGARSFPLQRQEHLLKDFDETGFAYRPYIGQDGYGISMAAPAWVTSCLLQRRGLVLKAYFARGWNRNHDVYVCAPA